MLKISKKLISISFVSVLVLVFFAMSLFISFANEKPLIIKMGLIASDTHPITLGSKKFAEIVEQKTNGRIKVEVFPGGALGGETDMRDNISAGVIAMGNLGTGTLTAAVPESSIFQMYYLWRDRDHMIKVMEGTIGEEIFEKYRKKIGIRILAANWQSGARDTISKKPIKSFEDLKGVKIRVTAGTRIYTDLWEALGCVTVPLSFPEVYMALQTGVVDAAEVPIEWIYNTKFYEVAKYITFTEHLMYVNTVQINDDFYSSLSKEDQKVLKEAAIEAGEYATKLILDSEAVLIEKMKAAGVTFYTVDKDPFIEAVQPVYKMYEDKGMWTSEFHEKIVSVK